MIQKPFDGTTKEDIDALADDEVRSGRTRDHKEKPPGNADKEKKDFSPTCPRSPLFPLRPKRRVSRLL